MFIFEENLDPIAKPVSQQRSRETRDRLIEALDGLLQEKDFEAIGIAEIAGRAGVSTASVYQRFDNKDAAVSMLLALYVRRSNEWWKRTSGSRGKAVESLSLRDALILVGKTAWQQFEDLHYLMRPAYLQSRLRPGLLDRTWNTSEERALQGFQKLLEDHAEEIGQTHSKRVAGMVAYFFNMMLLGRLLHRGEMPSWEIPGDAAAFSSELADFVCGYLQVIKGRPAPDPGDNRAPRMGVSP